MERAEQAGEWPGDPAALGLCVKTQEEPRKTVAGTPTIARVLGAQLT